MSATLVRSSAPSVPAIPAQSAGTRPDPLVEWAAGFDLTERGLALAVSDMPRKRDDIDAALGYPNPVFTRDGDGPQPRPYAARQLARWIAQGIERLGGDFEVWKYSMAMRRNGLRVATQQTDPEPLREYRQLCKPLGGVPRWTVANDKSHSFRDYLGPRPGPELVEVYANNDRVGVKTVLDRITRREADMKVRVGELRVCEAGKYRIVPKAVSEPPEVIG